MPRLTKFLTPALAALAFTGLTAAQEEPGAPIEAEQVELPAIEMADGRVVFRDPLTNEVLELDDEDVTPAVEEFRRTGENPYSGDEEATADGGRVYRQLCAACHLPAGSGRIGPSLVDDTWRYPRAETDVGRFEVIHAGGAGAMMAFRDRIGDDEILRVMAYVDQLREEARQ